MNDRYVNVTAFKDLFCDVYDVMERLNYITGHTGCGAHERAVMEWAAGKLKGTIERAEMVVENAEHGHVAETKSACGDCTADEEAETLAAAKEEATGEDRK